MKCVKCGKEADQDDRYCQGCGGHLTPSHPVVVAGSSDSVSSGTSKIQLDKNTVNILLKEFASKDGTRVSYEEGRFVVDRAGLRFILTELPLTNTRIKVDGNFGGVHLRLSDFQMGSDQVNLRIDVGLE